MIWKTLFSYFVTRTYLDIFNLLHSFCFNLQSEKNPSFVQMFLLLTHHQLHQGIEWSSWLYDTEFMFSIFWPSLILIWVKRIPCFARTYIIQNQCFQSSSKLLFSSLCDKNPWHFSCIHSIHISMFSIFCKAFVFITVWEESPAFLVPILYGTSVFNLPQICVKRNPPFPAAFLTLSTLTSHIREIERERGKRQEWKCKTNMYSSKGTENRNWRRQKS